MSAALDLESYALLKYNPDAYTQVVHDAKAIYIQGSKNILF